MRKSLKYIGGLKEDESYFNKVCTDFHWPQIPISGDRNISFLRV